MQRGRQNGHQNIRKGQGAGFYEICHLAPPLPGAGGGPRLRTLLGGGDADRPCCPGRQTPSVYATADVHVLPP
jgi:hypothetical protein